LKVLPPNSAEWSPNTPPPPILYRRIPLSLAADVSSEERGALTWAGWLVLIRLINEEDELRRWVEEDERPARTTEELRTLLVNIATVCKRFSWTVMIELI